jgi:hypothetical protein
MPSKQFDPAARVTKYDALIKSFNKETSLPNIDVQLPRVQLPRDFQSAEYQYEVIMERIQEFEANLDCEHEIAIKLAYFGETTLLNVTEIGYSNPCLLIFYGFVNGHKATLIQHVSNLSFLLLSVPKSDPDSPARRIGFGDRADT